MPGLLDDAQEYARRSGRNLTGLLDWLGGGAAAGAEPTMALMRGDALDQPFLPTADSGGRLGAVASAVGSTVMPAKAPAGALGAGPVMRGTKAALDMSPGARAARAQAAGFNLDRRWYHGTGEDIKGFDRPVYVTDDPVQASHYAEGAHLGGSGDSPNVIPLVMREQGVHNIDDILAEAMQTGEDMDAAVRRGMERAWKANQWAVEYSHPNAAEAGDHTVRVVLAPDADLRSPFAAFDPNRRYEPDLLASRPSLSGLLSQPQRPLTLDDLKDRL
jgi:hypothetical protein